jgi:hypothetical protein
MTKKLVTRYQYIDLENNIEQVIFDLQKAKAYGWEAVEHSRGDDYYSDSYSNYLTKQELETDQEYAKRTAQEKLQRQNQAEHDTREYKRLKAQFEK